MKAREVLQKVGNMHQLADVVPVTFQDGRAQRMDGWMVKNGMLQFTVMKDKCLDLAELSYRGIGLNFLSKPGLQGRNHYDTNGQEALRSIMGGMLFTCGLENICPPYHTEDKDYPMHGRIRTTPAEHTGVQTQWTEDGYEMSIHGEMREAELFGENMVLRRTITTRWPQKEIHIQDVVENQGFRPEPMMLLYHFNIGYPLLDEGTEIILPTRKVIPRDAAAEPHVADWNRMQAPIDNEPEYVFIHDLEADAQGNAFAAVLNDKLGLGVCITFAKKNLPYFMQWKSLASGDYVLGLEPANSSVYGRAYYEERGDLHKLEPFQSETMQLTLRILEGDELQEMRGRVK